MTRVILLGEHSPTFPPHAATEAALGHSSAALGVAVTARWLSSAEVAPAALDGADALWVAPGSPYRDLDRTLQAIRWAREQGLPCLGTCGGFQHMILEYARHLLGFQDAQHAEYDPYASDLFISRSTCSLAGREMRLTFTEGSRIAAIYGSTTAQEAYYCDFAVDPGHVPLLRQGPLQITGADQEGEVRAVELPEHPFYLGTLFVPQMRSRPEAPHPLVTAFLQAALGRARTEP
jgi:CTP synthase (UTP-ammonia lyase)